MLGADFVLTGSVNQCTTEADTSDTVKDLLAAAGVSDFATAPDEDGFELGGRIPVLRRGTLHPARAQHLYEVYLRHKGFADVEPAQLRAIEDAYLRRRVDDVPGNTADPRARLAAVARWYLRDCARRARAGETADRANFRVHSGPAVAAFNASVAGTDRADWRRRPVVDVAWSIMRDAAAAVSRVAGAEGGAPTAMN